MSTSFPVLLPEDFETDLFNSELAAISASPHPGVTRESDDIRQCSQGGIGGDSQGAGTPLTVHIKRNAWT